VEPRALAARLAQARLAQARLAQARLAQARRAGPEREEELVVAAVAQLPVELRITPLIGPPVTLARTLAIQTAAAAGAIGAPGCRGFFCADKRQQQWHE